MRGPCTGACCSSFTLKQGDVFFTPLSLAASNADQRIKDLMVPVKNQDGVFTCLAWDRATQRCTRYDDRPDMCLDYPLAERCHSCGALSDAEARGQALMVRM